MRKRLVRWIGTFNLPLLLVAVQTAILLLQTPIYGGDDPIRLQAMFEIANGHLPSIKFSLLHPGILAIPYTLLHEIGLGSLISEHSGAMLWLMWSFIIIRMLGRHRSPRYIASGLALSYCSMIAPYLLGFNTEVFSALLFSAGLALALLAKMKISRWFGWALTVIATANIPITIIAASVVSLYFVLTKRQLRYLSYPLAVLLVVIVEASIIKGHFTLSKYSLAGESGTFQLLPWGTVTAFGYPVFFGIIGILFSFGRGLLFYIPTLTLVRIKKHDLIEQWMMAQLLFLLALIPLYGAWWAWYGGVTFGPRFFMIGSIIGAFGITDVLYTKAKQIPHTILAVITAVWSGWVAIAGVIYYITPKVAQTCMQDNFRLEPLCWYSPEYSTIFAPFWEGGAITWQAKVFLLSVVVLITVVLTGTLKYVLLTLFKIVTKNITIVKKLTW